MEEGFSTRARAVREMLADPDTAYVLITSPRPDSIEEAAYFAARLAETGVEPAALVVNRVHPDFPPVSVPGEPAARWRRWWRTTPGWSPRPPESAPHSVPWSTGWRRVPVARLPLLAGDVHDLDGLRTMADHLFADTPGWVTCSRVRHRRGQRRRLPPQGGRGGGERARDRDPGGRRRAAR